MAEEEEEEVAVLKVRCVSCEELRSEDKGVRSRVRGALAEAFGAGGPGIILVRGLPQSFPVHRQLVLEAGSALPTLPPRQLEELEFPELRYSVGWSHGRETFNGVPDRSKASFYANPFYDDPSLGDHELVKKYP